MTTLLVIILVLAAGAALVAQLVWWLSGRPERERVPPPLIYPIHPRFARQPEAAPVESAQIPLPAPANASVVEIAVAEPAASDLSLNETVQFVRPTDEALQLLPARLEVVSGMTPQQVTLTSSTVSRRHARVAYADGHWLVTNLSRTNPVVVNDRAIAEYEGPRPLLDGDRIELGDVVLRFCTS